MLTQAQAQNRIEALHTVRDAIRHIPPSEIAKVLAGALLAHHQPRTVEAFGDLIAREAHMAARG